MSNNTGRGPGGNWKVTPWTVATAGEAANIRGPKMIVPDAQATGMRLAAGRPHGLCKNFDLRTGQELTKDQDFFNEILHGGLSDTPYLAEWFSKKEGYGICALIGSDTLIHALHPGTCTLEQAQNWGKAEGLAPWRRGEGDVVVCPCWELRQTQAGKGSRRR